ncbi:hypothetical protein ZHAS_00016860 [Anopheles sinensis]|uniref:Uncharacterized protein n=1 Tax=Anopheles sinensis TaxID=74873 RepID=A0A084WEA5_ANOSI|nr:hypothetical protein ZHAS_00016860 [Anopheles sinensis]
MELPILVAFLCVVTVSGVVRGEEVPTRSDTALVEPRYDRYYDIFRYWWPWFSDLATVVAIKLKIWVILVAMLVFGDGYYWSKWTGSSIFEKSQWAQTPAGTSWGRRRRRSSPSSPNSSDDLAEMIFDTLDIEDDECHAPTGWTVALYIWYIVKLGFILGALLLLLFAKKWNSRGQPIVIESGPAFYHHRSLDGPEHNLFKTSNREHVNLFWSDRIEAVVNQFSQ